MTTLLTGYLDALMHVVLLAVFAAILAAAVLAIIMVRASMLRYSHLHRR